MRRERHLSRRQRVRAPRRHQLAIEQLEHRRLLSINSTFSNNVLTVSTPDQDDIVISAAGGLVRVNGVNLSPQVSAAAVQQIVVNGGPGTALIDLSAVNASAFPAMQNSSIVYATASPVPAAVVIKGSALSDSVTIVGTIHDDVLSIAGSAVTANGTPISLTGIEAVTLDGRAGNDALTASNLTLPLTMLGDAGSDQILITQPGAVAIVVNAGADADSITLKNYATATSVSVIGNPSAPSLEDRLDLSNNGLASLGPLTVTNVGSVDVSHNQLTSLPAALSGAKSIDISHNWLTALSPAQSFVVETLDARYNRLATVGGLANFAKLATLYVYGNDPLLSLQPYAQQAIDIDLLPVGLERAETISPDDWLSLTSGMNAYSDAVEAALPKIAKALHYSPLKIFEYVRNNFAFQPYGGIMKGPLGTLATRAGNDWDQAGLLIALLEQAGVPANRTRFNFSTIQVSLETARRLVGVATDFSLLELLTRSGVNAAPTSSHIQIHHAWAEVQLYVPEQGGLQWVRMDPAWKFQELRPFLDFDGPGTSVLSTVPFDVPDYLSQDRDELAYEYYERLVSASLLANPNTRGLSIADIPVDGPIIASRVTKLTGLPTDFSLVGVVQNYQEYANIPSDLFHRVAVVVRTTGGQTMLNQGAPPSQQPIRTMDVIFNPIYLDFQSGLNSQQQPSVKPRIWFGQDLVATSTHDGVAPTGASVTYNLQRWTVGQPFVQHFYTRPAGTNQVFAVGIDAHQLTPSYVHFLQYRAEQNAHSLTNNSVPLSAADTAESLAMVIHDYLHKARLGQEIINRLTNGLPVYNGTSIGTSSGQTSFALYPTHQMPIVHDALRIDVKAAALQSISRNQPTADVSEYHQRNELIFYNASAQEHASLEELVNVESLSTVRVLQIAKELGQTIHVFNPSTHTTQDIRNVLENTAIPAAERFTASQVASVIAAFSAGNTIRVHTRRITVANPNPNIPGGWTGAAWVAASETQAFFAIDDGILTAGGSISNQVKLNPEISSNRNNVIAGDPVNVANGAVYEDVVDIEIPGVGIPIRIQRHYDSSNVQTSAGLQAGFGVGWTHSYSDYLDVTGLSRADYAQHGIDRIVPGGQAVWVDSNGQRHVFTAGNFAADHSQTWTNSDGLRGHFREYLGGPAGVFHVFEFIEASGVVRRFVQTNWDLDKNVRLAVILDYEQSGSTGTQLAFTYSDNFGRKLQSVRNVQNPESGLQFVWNAAGDRISQIRQTTSGGAVLRTWDYSYTNGQLTKVEAPAVPETVGGPLSRPTIRYEYETNFPGAKVQGLLRKIIHPDGGEIEHTYHPNGRGFQVIDPEGFSHAFQFDLFRSQARFFDEKGRLTVYDYDDKGNLELLVHPDRSREQFTWNANGYQLSRTDPAGLTERFTYGAGANAAVGNIATSELGFALSTGWQAATAQEPNAAGAIVSVPLVTTYTYDTRLRPFNGFAFSKVSSVTLPSAIPNARVNNFTYNTRGDLLTKTETIKVGETRTTSHVYDGYGRLLRTVDPRGDHGNPSTTNAFVTKFENFNALGQPTQISRWIETAGGQPVWAVEQFHFDAHGFLDWQVDANGFRTDFTVDPLGRRLKTIHPQPDKSQAQGSNRPETISKFDAMGNLLEVRGPAAGQVTTYAYNKRQQLLQTTNPDGSIVASTYDAVGAVTSTSDGLGQATNFIYDTRDRAVETLRDDGTRTFATFNARGAPVATRDAKGNETRLEYDVLGRLSRRILPQFATLLPTVSQQIWDYEYDAAGNRRAETLKYSVQVAGATQIVTDRTTTYAYDSLNRLIQRVDPDPDLVLSSPQNNGPGQSPVWTYHYDKANNLISTQLRPANVSTGSPATQRTDATFDGLNRQRTESKFISATAGDAVSEFTYDAVGNRLTDKDARGAVTEYAYDRWNRLVQRTAPDPDPNNAAIQKPIYAYTYDLSGNLLTETLREDGDTAANFDRKSAYTYDAMNRRLSTSHFEKNGSSVVLAQSSVEYDDVGKVVLELDANGNRTRHEYDSLNRRTRTIDALGGIESTTYDANGNVIVTFDARGNDTIYLYDSLNRLVRTFSPDPDGSAGPLLRPVATNIYNFANDLVITYLATEAQPFGRRIDYIYDQLHRLTTKLDAVPNAGVERHVLGYSYDVAGNLLTTTDPSGLITSYTHDGLGRRLTQIDPDPDGAGSGVTRTWGYAYDKNGNLVEARLDAPSQYVWRTTYEFDALNRQTQERRINTGTGAVYSTASTAYDVAGNVILTTDPAGRQTQFTYDGLDRVVDEQSLGAAGLPRTTSTYDAAGNLLTSTIVMADSANRTTTYAYDPLNRLLRSADPLGHVSAYRYDAVGNLTAEIDALGKTTTSVFDRLDRRIEVRDPLNRVTKTEYNEANNVTRVIDPNNNATTYQYDGIDRLWKELEGLGGAVPTTTYTYDLRSQIDTIVDRRGWKRDLDYDAFGRLTRERWEDPNQPGVYLSTVSFTYAADDQPTTASTGDTNYYYTYSGDPVRRLNRLQFNDGLGLVTLDYTYNLADQVTRIDVANTPDGRSYYQTFSYDAAGRTDVVQQSGFGATDDLQRADVNWNAANQVQSLLRGMILAPGQQGPTPSPTITDTWIYDNAGRLIQKASAGGGHVAGYEYTFDAADRVTSMKTIAPGDPTTSFTYNLADELTAADHQAAGLTDEAYTLDNAGNRTGGGRTYDAFNRLTFDGTYTYTYDAEGNLRTRATSGEHITYDWDHRNRLTKISYRTAAGAATTTREAIYRYDAFDRRVQKRVDGDGSGGPLGFAATDYVYSGDDLLLTRNALAQVTHRYLHAPGVDAALSDQATGSAARWIVTDHEGSVRGIVDPFGNNETDFVYDSFGRPAAGSTTPAAVDLIFGYAGGQFDGETGLQYHHHRYYDPHQGRFLSEDPTSFAGGDHNLYRYANGDPVNRTDPTGLKAKPLGVNSLFSPSGIGGAIAAIGNSIGYASALSHTNLSAEVNYGTSPISTPVVSLSPAGMLNPLLSGGSSSSLPTTFDPMVDLYSLGNSHNLAAFNGGGSNQVVGTRQIRSWLDIYDADVASGAIKPNLLESISIGFVRQFLPASAPTTVVTYADGSEEYIMGGGPSSGALGAQAAAILAPASAARPAVAGGSRIVTTGMSYLKEAGETAVDSAAQHFGSPISPTTLTSARLSRGWDATHPLIEGTIDTPRSASHKFLQQTVAEEAVATGAYSRVAMNRPLSEFSGIAHKPDIRPDVMGLSTKGQIDMIEILSPSQDKRRLERKLIYAQNQLPPEMRGGMRVIDPADAYR